VGVIRAHREGRGAFTPDNDSDANMWFWWDVPAMLETTAMPEAATPLPFVLHVIPVAGQQGFPRPVALRASVTNNHLQYAITWFSLALVLVLVTALFVRGQMKKSGA
ncbi:MAG: SURF1 family cytochrome oxidase biogenesis protein, partial [Methylocella sp.]